MEKMIHLIDLAIDCISCKFIQIPAVKFSISMIKHGVGTTPEAPDSQG